MSVCFLNYAKSIKHIVIVHCCNIRASRIHYPDHPNDHRGRGSMSRDKYWTWLLTEQIKFLKLCDNTQFSKICPRHPPRARSSTPRRVVAAVFFFFFSVVTFTTPLRIFQPLYINELRLQSRLLPLPKLECPRAKNPLENQRLQQSLVFPFVS